MSLPTVQNDNEFDVEVPSLFSFHSDFDDVDVTLVDESNEGAGPYIVTVECHAPEIGIGVEKFEFATLQEAYDKFLERVKVEIEAALDDSSFT